MGNKIKHKFKKILIKFKILSILLPFYEKLIYFSPYHRIKLNNTQKKLINFYSQFIKLADLCFDVGAHKGSKTEVFLKLGAKVVAIEPQKNCIKYLKSKFGKESNFLLIEKGLAERKGEYTMFICEEADDISTFSEKWRTGRFSNYEWNKEKLVRVTTLDNLIKEFGLPVFCKIDAEGFEYQVLKGLSQPIKYISFEFTNEFYDDAKNCISHLLSLGYTQFNCSIGETIHLLFPNWVTAENLFKKLNSIRDNFLWGDIYARH